MTAKSEDYHQQLTNDAGSSNFKESTVLYQAESETTVQHLQHTGEPATSAGKKPCVFAPVTFFSFESNTRSWCPEALARVLSSDIEDLCAANENDLDLETIDESAKMFFSPIHQPFPLIQYIQRLITYTECSNASFVAAVVYLDRLHEKHHILSLKHRNCHRLISTTLLLAIKFLDDEHCPNSYYADVFGLDLDELNILELELLSLLRWNLRIESETYRTYDNSLFFLSSLIETEGLAAYSDE